MFNFSSLMFLLFAITAHRTFLWFLACLIFIYLNIKDTHRVKALSNETSMLTKSTNMDIWTVDETPVLTESTNMDIWTVSTSNQLFEGG